MADAHPDTRADRDPDAAADAYALSLSDSDAAAAGDPDAGADALPGVAAAGAAQEDVLPVDGLVDQLLARVGAERANDRRTAREYYESARGRSPRDGARLALHLDRAEAALRVLAAELRQARPPAPNLPHDLATSPTT